MTILSRSKCISSVHIIKKSHTKKTVLFFAISLYASLFFWQQDMAFAMRNPHEFELETAVISKAKERANNGDVESQLLLGEIYECRFNHQCDPQDNFEAVKWFKLAAEQGNADAQWKLGMMYSSGRGVRQDFLEALKWFRKAAKQGNTMGQILVGSMYEGGTGVARDYNIAKKWYGMACDNGDYLGCDSYRELNEKGF